MSLPQSMEEAARARRARLVSASSTTPTASVAPASSEHVSMDDRAVTAVAAREYDSVRTRTLEEQAAELLAQTTSLTPSSSAPTASDAKQHRGARVTLDDLKPQERDADLKRLFAERKAELDRRTQKAIDDLVLQRRGSDVGGDAQGGE